MWSPFRIFSYSLIMAANLSVYPCNFFLFRLVGVDCTIQYITIKTWIVRSGRLLGQIWGTGSCRVGKVGYTLRVVREVRCVFSQWLKVSNLLDLLIDTVSMVDGSSPLIQCQCVIIPFAGMISNVIFGHLFLLTCVRLFCGIRVQFGVRFY